VTKVKMDEMRQVPVGGTSRDFTAVLDLSPTAQRDAAGVRLAGTSGAESKYVVDGANATNPAFGTVSATIVQEFVEEVEVLEAGYDAEYGGGSGGQVRARRIGGTNKFRGTVLLRFSPRIALPRFVAQTDESLRVAEIRDYEGQGVFTLSGPIIKDKLFFSVAVAPGGQKNSMIQSFYRRRDKDRSGGYEDCPYENGTNDCASNGNYIDSVKFAEQKFRTGNWYLQYQGVLDWQITPEAPPAPRRRLRADLPAQQLPPPAGQRAQLVRHQPGRDDRRQLARRPGRRQRHLRQQLRQRDQREPRVRGPRRRRQARDRRRPSTTRASVRSTRSGSTTRTSRTSR
jgi:hypothetical protein